MASDFKKFNLGLEEKVENRRVILRDTHYFVIPSNVIGRNRDKENIIDLLVKPIDTKNIPVIPIVRIGGLGKTTLAQLVYNDERITSVFPLKIWLCVSDEFDLARLLCDVIYSITGKRCDGLPVNALQTHLRMLLNGKTFLLVLDDVWNEDHVKWMELRDLLMTMGNFQQRKIIVTTWSSKVASIVGTIAPYNSKGLSHKDCLSLFVKWAFREGDEKVYPNLMRIGDEIVKKCKGVQLADTIYDTDYIVQFWMAIGLTESPKQNKEWENVGYDISKNYDDFLTIYPHTINAADHIRHLSFSGDNPLRAPQSFLKNLKGVRTLVILPSSGRNRIIEEHFVNASILNFKFLRLLDLSYSFLEVLPNFVGTLKHLRYLDLSRCYRMSKLPRSIYKLQSLLTLRLLDIDCQLQLPRNLQSLVNLRFLDLTEILMGN
ncbi:putative disease resistance protein RGA1 [Durio zibethinus]|uniref:Disease resistance protein RGA1 n=1 Tax=Durio zibethinus TaxID=66656 RepID=A0A6P5WVJ6_DURZI|nr:putative disease resistance protein RGA1 [Durio zibethinus]